MTNLQDMSDAELYRIKDIEYPPEDLGAVKDELSLREIARDYAPAYQLRMYFSTGGDGKQGPWTAAKDLASRTERPFTWHRTWGSWEKKIEWSNVVEFVCNPRKDPYVVALRDTIKLAEFLCRQYKQDAVLVTYQGDQAMRQWLIEEKKGD